MTIKHDITKRLNNLSDKRNIEGLLYCMHQNEHCDQVNLNGDWVSYGKLPSYQKNRLSSSICPDCSPDPFDLIENFKIKLKREAIKWAKSRNTGGFSFIIDSEGKVSKWNKEKEELNAIDLANLGAMIEIINFFNLTEEDIKNFKEKKC